MSKKFAAIKQQTRCSQATAGAKLARCLLVLSLLVSAVTHAYDNPSDVTATQNIEERAQMRWDALVAGQIETAYEFANPGFRSAIPLEHYIQRQTHIGARWIAAQVERVDCSATRCEVSVNVTYQLPDPGMAIDFERQFEEIWILTDEQWWIYLST